MNVSTLIIGLAALAYGGFTAYVRQTNPARFAKLTAMKKAWGDAVGTTIHFLSYTVMPILFGLVLIWAASRGYSIGDLVRR